MTDKLYEEDAYLREFEAEVTGCTQRKGGWLVTLDRTAFYPEGGGQPADTGTLGGARVLDVHEKEGEVVHTTDAPLPAGGRARGAVDWEARFSRMQQHTGEHIVSGIIHRLFGLDNVGFHMGHDAVTIDLNGELTADDLGRVERLANEAVWENLPVEVDYPSPGALAALDYRSKKELTGRVRIVTVPGSDVCACCGTHVRRTGEIGVIKLLTSQRYKGGVRVWLLCGDRALRDYGEKNAQAYAVSGMLSAKVGELAGAVERMQTENDALKLRAARLQEELFHYRAREVEEGATYALLFEDGMEPPALRRFCLALCERCGVAAVLSGSEREGWKYAVGSARGDVRPLGRELNAAFSGRGGGSPELVQGTLSGSREEIDTFFRSRV